MENSRKWKILEWTSLAQFFNRIDHKRTEYSDLCLQPDKNQVFGREQNQCGREVPFVTSQRAGFQSRVLFNIFWNVVQARMHFTHVCGC